MRRLLFQTLINRPVTEKAPRLDDGELAELAARVDVAARRRLGRSLSIREVDSGSCNGCELEIHALNNPIYDLERFGIHFVALSSMATLIGLSAILLGMLAKVAIAIYHPTPRGRVVPWLKKGRPLEWLVGVGTLLAVASLVADAMLAFKWLFVGGPMEQSAHLSFAITTACVAGVVMALSGFVLKLLLDSVNDREF